MREETAHGKSQLEERQPGCRALLVSPKPALPQGLALGALGEKDETGNLFRVMAGSTRVMRWHRCWRRDPTLPTTGVIMVHTLFALAMSWLAPGEEDPQHPRQTGPEVLSKANRTAGRGFYGTTIARFPPALSHDGIFLFLLRCEL